MELWLLLGIITFFSSVTLRLAGFGAAMVGVPLFTPLIGVTTAVPLMTLLGVSNTAIAVGQFRKRLNPPDVWQLLVGLAVGIPIGVASIAYLDERFLRVVIGATCLLFAAYRFVKLPLPEVVDTRWRFLVGTLSGLLGGAISIPGVPVVVYAETQNWEIERYRINLFTFFLTSASISTISRLVAGQFTETILVYFLQAIPFLLAGQLVGHLLTRYVDRGLFRYLVLVLIAGLGVRLVL